MPREDDLNYDGWHGHASVAMQNPNDALLGSFSSECEHVTRHWSILAGQAYSPSGR